MRVLMSCEQLGVLISVSSKAAMISVIKECSGNEFSGWDGVVCCRSGEQSQI